MRKSTWPWLRYWSLQTGGSHVASLRSRGRELTWLCVSSSTGSAGLHTMIYSPSSSPSSQKTVPRSSAILREDGAGERSPKIKHRIKRLGIKLSKGRESKGCLILYVQLQGSLSPNHVPPLLSCTALSQGPADEAHALLPAPRRAPKAMSPEFNSNSIVNSP